MSISPLNYACKRLARRPHSIAEIKTLLARAGYDDSQIQQTIAKLIASCYLDDLALARKMLEYYTDVKPCGPILLAQKMRTRGLSSAIIQEVMLDYDEDRENTILESLTIKASSRHKKDVPYLLRHLQRKGFTSRNIKRVVHKEFSEEDFT